MSTEPTFCHVFKHDLKKSYSIPDRDLKFVALLIEMACALILIKDAKAFH